MTKYTRATQDDITRIWKQLWGGLTPKQVQEITKKEDEMNGYTPTIELAFRVNNLLEQIPQEYRARACRECYGTDDFGFERNLTAYVLHRTWETYDHPVNEAEFVDGFCDERLDTGLTDDRPYRAGDASGEMPF